MPSVRSSGAAFDSLYLKVTWRILPIIVICYIISYIDRVNVSFAKLEMSVDLGISELAYGFGAGIFFLGYFLFEVPSNLIMHRIGARIWIARIMVTWGIISGMMAFTGPIADFFGASHETTFYVLRFLLGAAEAGFFPGIILYFNYWYTSSMHSRVMALLLMAQPVSFILGAPISGGLMQAFADSPHMHGWQWMFVLEALPAVILGIVILFYLSNGIDDAKWLTANEKAELKRRVIDEEHQKKEPGMKKLFTHPTLWLLTVIYLLLVIGIYGVNFWLPTIIKATGVTSLLEVGFVTAIPYLCGIIAMLMVTKYAEKSGRRHAFAAGSAVVGGVGLIISAYFHDSLPIMMAGIAIAVAGSMSASALFWSFPGSILKGVAVAAGIASINSFGNLGGFLGPYILGFLSSSFGASHYGFAFLGVCMGLAGLLMAWKCGALVRPPEPEASRSIKKTSVNPIR